LNLHPDSSFVVIFCFDRSDSYAEQIRIHETRNHTTGYCLSLLELQNWSCQRSIKKYSKTSQYPLVRCLHYNSSLFRKILLPSVCNSGILQPYSFRRERNIPESSAWNESDCRRCDLSALLANIMYLIVITEKLQAIASPWAESVYNSLCFHSISTDKT
jgi:hypothetical protein